MTTTDPSPRATGAVAVAVPAPQSLQIDVPRRPSAGNAVLRWSWAIVIFAIAVAVIVYIASNRIPATYASTAKVAVTVSGGTDANDSSLGANNIASQDAQMVSGSQVLALAGRRIHGGIPSSSITGGVVGAQNLISIQATASSPSLAQKRAQAVARAFISYTNGQTARQIAAGRRQSAAQLRPLDAQIAALQKQVDALGSEVTAKSTSIQQTLVTLVTQRTTVITNIAEAAVDGRASVSLIDDAAGGSKTSPKPELYAAVGLVVALLVFARLAVYLDPRRRRAA